MTIPELILFQLVEMQKTQTSLPTQIVHEYQIFITRNPGSYGPDHFTVYRAVGGWGYCSEDVRLLVLSKDYRGIL